MWCRDGCRALAALGTRPATTRRDRPKLQPLVCRPTAVKRIVGLLVATVLAGCGTSAPPAPNESSASGAANGLAAFDEGGIAFVYPAGWRVFHHRETSSFSSSIADLATVDVPEPCVTMTDAVGTSTECGDRFHLEPDTLVVHVTSGGMPGFTILQPPAGAETIAVDGLPAWFVAAHPENPAVGADAAFTWTLARPQSVDNFLSISALVRGPDVAVLKASLDALIASVHYDPAVVRLPETSAERDAAVGNALDQLASSSAAWRCFPAQPGIRVGTISEYPGGPALTEPRRATCRTEVERTALQLWRATFSVTLDEPDPVVGGRFAVEVWIAPDGTPGEMTSGSAAP